MTSLLAPQVFGHTPGDLGQIPEQISFKLEVLLLTYVIRSSGAAFGKQTKKNDQFSFFWASARAPWGGARPTPGSDLNSQRDRPLKELGGEAATWAVVRGDQRGVLLRVDSCLKSPTHNDQETNHEA